MKKKNLESWESLFNFLLQGSTMDKKDLEEWLKKIHLFPTKYKLTFLKSFLTKPKVKNSNLFSLNFFYYIISSSAKTENLASRIGNLWMWKILSTSWWTTSTRSSPDSRSGTGSTFGTRCRRSTGDTRRRSRGSNQKKNCEKPVSQNC